MTDASKRLLFLLQVANASFPTGAFNHSYGFETWFDDETVGDAGSFERACRDWLLYAVASADGAAVAHAHRHAAAGDLDALVALDHEVGALKLSRESREASLKTGQALLSALTDVFEPKGLEPLAGAIAAGRCDGHQALVFGAAAEGFGIAERETVLVFLQSAVANLAGVACRLIPLGQVETQRIIHKAELVLVEAAERACRTERGMLGTAMAGLDIASMRHERLHTRLCMS